MKEKIDKRVLRTKRDIREAFLSLLAVKDYKNITIQDILDKAQINRTTFYKHYSSKHNLALQMMNEFRQEFMIPVAQQRFKFTAKDFLERVIPVLNMHRPLLTLLMKIDAPDINLLEDIHQLAKQRYIDFFMEKTGKSAQELDFQGDLYASVTQAILKYRLLQDREISMDLYPEVVTMFKRAIL